MVIHDGYAVVSYDYQVQYSDHKCLFDMKETLLQKERRLLEDDTRTPFEAVELL
jgi:hypothetical protein